MEISGNLLAIAAIRASTAPGHHGLRVAVLANDFGAINVDAELVAGVESGADIISLANGCVCCNIRDDLLGAVYSVIVSFGVQS